MKRSDPSQSLSHLDYGLSLLASLTVLVSAGISIQNAAAGWALFGVAAIGHLYSAFGPRPTWTYQRLTVDGMLFSITAMVCVFFGGPLNDLLPGEGFPPTLLYTAGLAWAMAAASFFTWRDSTLLFLGVPGIALFGLIGAFDTFALAPLMFFVFLLCTAMLFARSHMRSMVARAEEAGESDIGRLRSYAWKSVAGPEWALTSAIAIIALSALGAPIIKNSVQEATSPLRVPVRNAAQNNALASAFNSARPNPNQSTVRVGQGPMGKPSESPVLVARMSEATYLRGEAYYDFGNDRWSALNLPGRRIQPTSAGAYDFRRSNPELVELGKRTSSLTFELKAARGDLPGMYLPGIVTNLNATSRQSLLVREDGIIKGSRTGQHPSEVSGLAVFPTPGPKDKSVTPAYYPKRLNDVTMTPRVRRIMDEALVNSKSDYDKAYALRNLVARRITYNLQAPALERGKNVLDEMLFSRREGYCDLFATTLALLARANGLPSRVAVGFLVSEFQRQNDDSFIIREADYHMWTEIYFEGAGWVTFDATDGAAEVPGSGRGSVWREPTPWYETAAARQVGNIIIGFCLVAFLAVAFWETLRRIWRRPSEGVKPPDQIRREWDELALRALRDVERVTGSTRQFAESSTEYLERIQIEFPAVTSEVAGLSESLDALLYAEPSEDMCATAASVAESRAKLTALKSMRPSR